ncbi:MAG: hypothetical protein D4R65_13075 [Verrucomicrobiaceae bacterium]|nr:MAG: hypothetical protein D4R65_13075 [Verrucomicrobiaceae bacterium]
MVGLEAKAAGEHDGAMSKVTESTVVLGCGFAAKYPEGGGNFSVPLQYLLGLRRMRQSALWLEVMHSTGDPARDARWAGAFRRRLREFGLDDSFCLIVFPKGSEEQDLSRARFFGLSRRKFLDLLGGPTVLLNLSYSIRMPLLGRFAHRKLCSLDPTEVCFWMQRMEMGQSYHEEFWSIGLNMHGPGSRVPSTIVPWKTYFPLVDTTLFEAEPRPPMDRFTTIGQWYWDGMIEWDGEWRDFSKKAAFEKFDTLPALYPKVRFELAMNLASDDPERGRIKSLGWKHVVPHAIARTPRLYYDYLRKSTAEFSAVKLESFAMSGWLSDRSAVYLALGRPVISEPTGADAFLPDSSGMFFVRTIEEASEAVARVCSDWKSLSHSARDCAVECFDAVVNLKKILN